MAKDPADTQKIWTNKHCSLQLVSLCNKTCGKKKVLQCSGIQSTEQIVSRYFSSGQRPAGHEVIMSVAVPLCFPTCAFFFKVAAFLVSDPIVLRMENPHTD